jgi:hypothetical protein
VKARSSAVTTENKNLTSAVKRDQQYVQQRTQQHTVLKHLPTAYILMSCSSSNSSSSVGGLLLLAPLAVAMYAFAVHTSTINSTLTPNQLCNICRSTEKLVTGSHLIIITNDATRGAPGGPKAQLASAL